MKCFIKNVCIILTPDLVLEDVFVVVSLGWFIYRSLESFLSLPHRHRLLIVIYQEVDDRSIKISESHLSFCNLLLGYFEFRNGQGLRYSVNIDLILLE